MSSVKRIGILTAGGDSPGLNAAIRGVGKAALGCGIEIVGFRDGFRGLAENRMFELSSATLSGILTVGGTVLGTSRDKVHRMVVDGTATDVRDTIIRNCRKDGIDVLVCLGGGGTQRNALQLVDAGLDVVTLPKTIDNDVALTDATIGYATALEVATEAVDRLHSTAHSHHRIIVVELMGHRAGWLALGAGIAGGADVVLIPEIPYDVEQVAEAIRARVRRGTNFSIVAVAEGARDRDDARTYREAEARKDAAGSLEEKDAARAEIAGLQAAHAGNTMRLARKLEELTGLESRVTILGYVQRGGTPSPGDRLLATRLGAAAVDLVREGRFGTMVAARGPVTESVRLEDVAGRRRTVPPDHPWVEAARRVGTCLGD
ncbi:MAG: ATP-dependent 6-phosphofructokinase [Chloroflexi bacterium]|nr:ATP-dependent 6-phosphofructokinase [Chloroflexota bacterium]